LTHLSHQLLQAAAHDTAYAPSGRPR
jgi:hypothetical protein